MKADGRGLTELRRFSGFTLIELIAVLLIVALLSTVTALSLTGLSKTSQAGIAMAQIKHLDRQMREYCHRFNVTADLVIDVDQGNIRSVHGASDIALGSAVQLSERLRLDSVQTARGKSRSGRVRIGCAGTGRTESYCLILTEESGKSSQLLAIGLTGEFVEVSDAQTLTDTFKILDTKRHDLN